MNEDLDNLLDEVLTDVQQIEQQRAQAQMLFETSVMKRLMTLLSLENEIPHLCRQVKDITGYGRLTFANFHENYPSFPLWLGIQKLPYIHQMTIQDLFNKFTKSKIIQAWEDVFSGAPENKPVGLIFSFAGIKGNRLMICHNLDYNTRNDPVFVRVHYAHNYSGELHNLCLEQFISFIKYIKLFN